jgi:hypothetical protein
MHWRTVFNFLGCLIMIGAAVAIAKTMGDDFIRFNRHYDVLVKEYGGAVAIGLPVLFFLGGVIALCGYIFSDNEKKQTTRSTRQNRRRRKYKQ